jgi:hypothetical protein
MLEARRRSDQQPAFTLIASCLQELGVMPLARRASSIPLDQARDGWLSRLRSTRRSASTLSGYRVALDDLLAFLARTRQSSNVYCEQTIAAYLNDYRRRAEPAAATYYRRTHDDVSDFGALLVDFRRRVGRPVAILLVHHEKSGAWSRLPDTLVHVRLHKRKRTPLLIRKARHSSAAPGASSRRRSGSSDGF